VLQLLCAAVGNVGTLSGHPGAVYAARAKLLPVGSRASDVPIVTTTDDSPGGARRRDQRIGLKRGFKTIFGETIFDFSVRCRMQHALTLLRGQRTPVASVAAAVGYRHQTSFATAFRRHFGVRQRTCARLDTFRRYSCVSACTSRDEPELLKNGARRAKSARVAGSMRHL